MSDLEPNDIQRGRAEAVALEPILATAPRGRTQGVSLTKAATALLALARLVRDQGWRPRFERLPLEDWSITHLDVLEARALALHVLLRDLATAEAGSPGPRVPLSTVRKAHKLRAEVLELLEFALKDDADVRELASIRSGTGYSDLQSDLIRLAVLLRARKDTLAEEAPRRFNPAHADDAERLAAEILAAITDGQTPAVRELALKIEKVFGLVDVDYDQVVRAGTFIFWGKPEQAHFVALRSAAR